MLTGELCDAAVDGAPDGVAAPSQIEVDAGGVSPRIGSCLEIVLMLEVDGKHAPFALRHALPCSSSNWLKRVSTSVIVSLSRAFKCVSHLAVRVAEYVHPDRGVNQNHGGYVAWPCSRNRPGAGSLPARSVRSRLRCRRTSSSKAKWTSSRLVRTPVSEECLLHEIVVQHNVGSHVSCRFLNWCIGMCIVHRLCRLAQCPRFAEGTVERELPPPQNWKRVSDGRPSLDNGMGDIEAASEASACRLGNRSRGEIWTTATRTTESSPDAACTSN